MRYDNQLAKIEAELKEIDGVLYGKDGLAIRACHDDSLLPELKAVSARENRLMAERARCEARETPTAHKRRLEREHARYMRDYRNRARSNAAATILANYETGGTA